MPTVINRSTVLSDDEVRRMVAACDRQMKEHFAPAHELKPWDLVFEGRKYISIYVVDEDRDVPNALGYHDYDGRPVGVVMAKTALDYGEDPSVTLSHEYLEIRLDGSCVLLGDGYWLEACDAVQSQCYDLDGVDVSNFCTPHWWNPKAPPPYDYLGFLTRPQEVARGGYQVRYGMDGGTTVYGDKPPYHGWRGLSRG